MSEQLRSIKDIKGYSLGAQDGTIGACRDFLFDDKSWVIRYIVADTRKWLPGQKVLISPISIGAADALNRTINIGLTQDQIKEAPPLESAAPVSRQYEILFNKYYDWSHYWGGALAWGPHPYPRLLQRPEEMKELQEPPEEKTNLRSTEEVLGYQIQATNDDIGHVEDFIIEEETWIIRYLVIDTSNWLPGSKRVIVSPSWADMVDWGRSAIVMKVSTDKIKESPEYDPSVPFSREYEEKVHDIFGFPYYW